MPPKKNKPRKNASAKASGTAKDKGNKTQVPMSKKEGNSQKTVERFTRRSAQEKLLHRLYEPLVLLHILDKHGGLPVSQCPSQDDIASQAELKELRRSSLNQLAYVCDHSKGGPTVTAIALESAPSGVTYWVTSNCQVSKSTIDHLNSIIKSLRGAASVCSDKETRIVEEQIADKCIDFSHKRLRDYQKLFQKNLENCQSILSTSGGVEDKTLASWLKQFQCFGVNLSQLCHFAYRQRHCHCMGLLQKHIRDKPAILAKVESNRQYFINARHYIGRLGSHLKAARILVLAGSKLPNLFENFSIEILPSAKPPIFPPPPDDLTTLDGILKRMLPKDSKDIPRYKKSLEFMDLNFDLQHRLLVQYNEKEFRPRVHAELHLLEHFHTNDLNFEDCDKFIGCSKPACYCCYHYIRLHPGGFELPATHGVRYINWRPPEILKDVDRDEIEHQQKVLINGMIAHFRRDALRQIDQRAGPSCWRPDTTTGITPSLDEEHLIHSIDTLDINDDSNSLVGGYSSEYEDGESGGCALE